MQNTVALNQILNLLTKAETDLSWSFLDKIRSVGVDINPSDNTNK